MKKVLRIGIIDADLIGRDKHRFPNLVCEKISAYWKEKGAETHLLLDYKDMKKYDEVYISKVFTDTACPDDLNNTKWLAKHPHIHIGGTGFYFDKAPNLPDEIEHHMPDYHLYDEWINENVEKARRESGDQFDEKKYKVQFKEYLEYSIGFLTRGCFRKCGFCVNQKYDRVFMHSSLKEFYDESRKKICLLDDNFFGCPNWKEMLQELIATGRKFKFKQGLDERLLTDEKCKMLFNSNYDGDFTFAFDKISDYDIIHEKLKLIAKYKRKKSVKFYVLVGYDSTDAVDIENAFKRIELILRYGCLPYIMRFQNQNVTPWKDSKYRSLYVAIARWCNQPNIIKKMSFRDFCERNQFYKKDQSKKCSTLVAMEEFEKEYPKIAKNYFDIRMENMNVCNKCGEWQWISIIYGKK
ncbi:MAG: hypothetical protein K2I36_00150 [Ureaplasma sp.]|nr:hypothetical protein [Ureaplasma sp.]